MSAAPAEPAAPRLAIVANSHTPYRAHLHLRIVREIPELKLASLYTHAHSSGAAWQFAAGDEIGTVLFGPNEPSAWQGRPLRQPYEWRKGKKIIRWMKAHNVRAVVMNGYNDAARYRIIRWCHASGVPLFLFGDSNVKGDLATGLKARIKRGVVGHILRRVSAVFPCGTLGRDYFVKYGADPARVYFFPYEPDYAGIESVDEPAVAAAAGRFELDRSRRRIVYSGRLVPEKRVDLLFDAFIALADRRPEWDLLIVGQGPLEQALRARLPPPLRGRVTWTGFIDQQRTVSALYKASDVLVLPSDYEPWAVVINEAAAAGLAMVASDVVGAAAELVRDGVNGRLFRAGDLGALESALADVTDPARIESMKAASAGVLADWRHRGDPIAGLRRALADFGVLKR